MDAARQRERNQMVQTAQAVWRGTHLDGRDLQAWCAELLGQDMRLPPEALAGTLAKFSVGMHKITWAEALKERPYGHS